MSVQVTLLFSWQWAGLTVFLVWMYLQGYLLGWFTESGTLGNHMARICCGTASLNHHIVLIEWQMNQLRKEAP